MVIDHVGEDAAYRRHPAPAMYGFESYISVPIVLPNGTFFGTLCAIDPTPARVNTPEVIGTFRMFADLIGFHLDANRRVATSTAALRLYENIVQSDAAPICVFGLDYRQKLEAVGQLTGGVAHDFNNLLTVIKSSSDLLKRPDLPEERRTRYIDAISDTVDRAAKLTGQLLAFARRQALKPEVFEVGEALRGIGEMIDTVMGARVRLVTVVTDEPCHVRADRSQFETAVVNMAVNACDAMGGEGPLPSTRDDPRRAASGRALLYLQNSPLSRGGFD